MASRRQFLITGVLGAVTPGRVLRAQTRRATIGMLSTRPLAESLYSRWVVERLAELGYRPGQGMDLHFRSADSKRERFFPLAKELIALKCDVIFAVGSEQAMRALTAAGATTPLVFVAVDYDPVAKGLVSRYNRPGSNSTGVYMPILPLVRKRLEILKEVVPAAKRFLALSDPFSGDQLVAMTKAAEGLGLKLTTLEFKEQPYDYDAGFESARKEGVDGVVLPASPVIASHISALASLAVKYRMPAIGFTRSADAGLLLSYSVESRKFAARAADLAVQILRGAKPAEIPLEEPSQYEFVVNLRTARALGIKVPIAVLTRATRLIE